MFINRQIKIKVDRQEIGWDREEVFEGDRSRFRLTEMQKKRGRYTRARLG